MYVYSQGECHIMNCKGNSKRRQGEKGKRENGRDVMAPSIYVALFHASLSSKHMKATANI